MTFPHPKTLEEHREYLYEIVKLKLWFIQHWLKTHPEESFVYVLRERVDIYRKTDVNDECMTPQTLHWDDPRWRAMEQAAEDAYIRHIDDPATFEAEAFQVFKPSLDAHCQRDFSDVYPKQFYQCGCFKHENRIADGTGLLTFHIHNFCKPMSFLDYPDYTKGAFMMLLDHAENMFHATGIRTSTWLNSNKRWQSWFPEEWLLNMEAPNMDIRWHYGFWGQFVNARGAFNFKYGQYLRETGLLPYYPRASHCSIGAMREKLTSLEF